MIVTRTRDLDELIARRASEPGLVGALLAIEGAHALEGKLDNLDVLYDAGYRMIGLHHFFDNDAGGSAHGAQHSGLTNFGSELIQRAQAKHMVVDLAHSSPRVIEDSLKITTAPVIVSHTGVRGTCDNERNLSDDHVRGIAATGGVMGIAMFEYAAGGRDIKDTARAIRYGANLAGVDHFAIGSDFDGAIATSIDATGLPRLTAALIEEKFSEEEISKIMGGNAMRVLRRLLPA